MSSLKHCTFAPRGSHILVYLHIAGRHLRAAWNFRRHPIAKAVGCIAICDHAKYSSHIKIPTASEGLSFSILEIPRYLRRR
jgi:hypothetical protein